MVCGFSAHSAEKPHTDDGKYHAAAGKWTSDMSGRGSSVMKYQRVRYLKVAEIEKDAQ
jgi:hypothetical protein